MRSARVETRAFGLMAGLGFTIALITMVVAQLSWRGWVSGVRTILRGEALLRPTDDAGGGLEPFAADVRARLRDLENEVRRSQMQEAGWTPERLRGLLNTQLRGDQVILVSNREPYIHDQGTDGIVVKRRGGAQR